MAELFRYIVQLGYVFQQGDDIDIVGHRVHKQARVLCDHTIVACSTLHNGFSMICLHSLAQCENQIFAMISNDLAQNGHISLISCLTLMGHAKLHN